MAVSDRFFVFLKICLTHMQPEDTTNTAFKTKLANLCKARFPLIFLTTPEEERAEGFIDAIARDAALIKTPRRVYRWSVTVGLSGEGMNSREDTRELVKALAWFDALETPALLVIVDLQDFAVQNGAPANPHLVRRVKELSASLRLSEHPKNILFIAPSLKMPTELEKEVHVLDLHLPTFEEIHRVLKGMMEANCKNGRVQVSVSPDVEERLVKAALGLTLKEAENAFAYAMVEDGVLSLSDVNVILEEKCQVLRKSDVLEVIRTEQGIQDVGGLENLKVWLKKRNNAWLDHARKYGLPAPKGILLTGVPGCGKSLVAKAISSAWQLPLLRLDPGRIYGSLMGSSEENIRNAIKTTEAVAPCILWIDEIEKGFSPSQSHGDSGTSSRVFGSFLTWLQEKTKPVFVIATANEIDALPPEFLRKGRFDEIFFVNLPTRVERMNILYIHLKKRLKHPEVIGRFQLTQETLAELALRMEGFNGAEIEHVVVSALFEAFSENRSLEIADLVKAVEATVPLSKTQFERIQGIRDWARERALDASFPDASTPDIPSALVSGAGKDLT